MGVDPDAQEVCVEGKPGCTDPHYSDAVKAAILDDLVAAFADEWWTIDEDWVVIDGSTKMSAENAGRLRAMLQAQRD